MAMSYQSISAGSFNFSKSQSLTSLIVVNKNGNFYMYAMTLLADSSYLNGDYTKLQRNTYRSKDKNFSGKVFYHRMDGSFVNGWSFQNGMVNGIVTLAAPNVAASHAGQSAKAPVSDVAEVVNCSTTTTTIYWEQCSYYTNDVNDAHPISCFDYTTSSSYTTCSEVGSGGGTSAPNPCTVSSGSGGTSDSLVNNAKFGARVADPNPPGGSAPPGGIVDQTNQIGTKNCTTPATPADTTTFKILICGGLTPTEKANIQNTINAFKVLNCAAKFLANNFKNLSFSFCIDSVSQNGGGSINYNPVNNSFIFTTDYAATPTYVDLIEHEFFHLYQNTTYPGGTAAYAKSTAPGASNPAGFVNIEFEEAIFLDIATKSHTVFDSGTQAQITAYSNWINSLTDNGTIYPDLTPGTQAYTTFIAQYNSFLSQYNDLPNNPNSSPIINLTPQAFIDIFQIVTPNC